MEIKPVYVVRELNIHATLEWRNEKKPRLDVYGWYYSGEPLVVSNYNKSEWVKLIANRHGTMATYIKFDNGEEILL